MCGVKLAKLQHNWLKPKNTTVVQLLHCLGGAASQVGAAGALMTLTQMPGVAGEGAGAVGSLSSATGNSFILSRTADVQDFKVSH